MIVSGLPALLELLGLALSWAGLFAEVEATYNRLRIEIEAAGQPEAFTPEERAEMLRRLTGQIAALDLDLACYPTGYTTTLLFDREGNLLP